MNESQLEKLRELISCHGIGYYLVLSQDAHCSEYVSDADKRREWVTGFTGSAGTAVVGSDGYLELATDGRYWQQAGQQLGSNWVLRKEGSQGVTTWSKAISERAKAEGVAIGVDPRLVSYEMARAIRATGVQLKPVYGLVDECGGAPSSPSSPHSSTTTRARARVFAVPTTSTGQSFESKVSDLRQALRTAGADVIVLSALDEIAWLLNFRGVGDVAYNPVFKAYVTVDQSEVSLYIDAAAHELPDKDIARQGIVVRDYEVIFDDIRHLSQQGRCIWVPPHSSWAMATAAGSRVLLDRASPVELAKAIKNPVEIDGARRAQQLCGKSIVELLSWAQKQVRAGNLVSEYDAAQELLRLRSQLPEFKGLSFETISCSGKNAAIIHYAPPPSGSRLLSTSEVFLLDSGCQFTWGTTDTTRTCWFGESDAVPDDVREAYTLVLKGHIALATAVFPQGTHGYKLDTLARQFLWRYGLDYAHGTGHGVGSYLNVHEGPIGISSVYSPNSVPLEVGNLISNEPGFYKPDAFGIRIESLVVVKPAEPRRSTSAFLRFETVTCVPFDRNLIDPSMLSAEELNWVNEYQAWVAGVLAKELDGAALEYLLFHTTPISH